MVVTAGAARERCAESDVLGLLVLLQQIVVFHLPQTTL